MHFLGWWWGADVTGTGVQRRLSKHSPAPRIYYGAGSMTHPDGNDSRRCCHNDRNFSRRACVRLDHRLLTYDGLILFRKSKTRFDVRETQADDRKIFRQMTVSRRRSRWLSAPAGDRAKWKIATWIGPPPDSRTNLPDVTKFSLRYSVITLSIVVIGYQLPIFLSSGAIGNHNRECVNRA